MVSPAVAAPRALRVTQQGLRPLFQTRGLAAAASGSFQYQTGEAAGVQYASRDLPSATTTLAVIAKAGSRYQPYPAFSDALEKFAFKVGPNSAHVAHSDRTDICYSLRRSDRPYE